MWCFGIPVTVERVIRRRGNAVDMDECYWHKWIISCSISKSRATQNYAHDYLWDLKKRTRIYNKRKNKTRNSLIMEFSVFVYLWQKGELLFAIKRARENGNKKRMDFFIYVMMMIMIVYARPEIKEQEGDICGPAFLSLFPLFFFSLRNRREAGNQFCRKCSHLFVRCDRKPCVFCYPLCVGR